MFWWFGTFWSHAIRSARNAGWRHELRIINPDGSEHVETFDRSDDLNKRQQDFELELAKDGWTGPHGWVV